MNLIFFETIDSTNTYAKKNIDSLADKDIVHTNHQTQGRGRFDRSWTDLGAENIYMTIVLKPSDKMDEVYSNLTQYLSVILCRELEELGLKPQIKWPNDVLLNGKKVCGILAEAVFKGGNLKGIALGIGVNLNASRVDLSQIDRPATSVNLELWEDINRNEFMQKLLNSFFEDYEVFLEHGFSSIREEYKLHASFLNQTLKIAVFETIKEGFSKDINEHGALVLTDKNGEDHVFNMGEII